MWFFPGLLASVSDTKDVVLSFVGVEAIDGQALYHLRAWRKDVNPSAVQELSRVDIYLDASYLPVRAMFMTHPDNDMRKEIPVEIRYSEYEREGGVAIPRSIRRYLQSSLDLDITITSAKVNVHPSDSEFSIQ
jgi:hypothetical protein